VKNKERKLDVSAMMGGVVLVDHEFSRFIEFSSLNSSMIKKAWGVVPAYGRPGWVVGQRWLQTGVIKRGYGGDDPNTWEETEPRIPCLLVSYWPTMTPVKVPMNCFRLAPFSTRPYAPHSSWTSRQRKFLSKESKTWPRDEKGRWTSQ